MDDIRRRLIKCYSAAFPELTDEEIRTASPEQPGNWDSLSWVTLLALIEEEFEMKLEAENMDGFQSFDAVLKRVNEAVQSRVPTASSRAASS
jgi:acyl carrier protein